MLASLGRIMRRYPMVGGIDLAGTVLESSDPDFKAGDAVVGRRWVERRPRRRLRGVRATEIRDGCAFARGRLDAKPWL